MSDGDQGFVEEHAITQPDESVVHPKYSDILRKEAPKTGIHWLFLLTSNKLLFDLESCHFLPCFLVIQYQNRLMSLK